MVNVIEEIAHNGTKYKTAHDGVLTIQKNGTDVQTFSANSAENKVANITVPTKTSDLANDSGFIVNSVTNLANYYLKTETYNQTQVNELIGAIKQFHYEIYAKTTDIKTPAGNVLYLIGPSGTGTDQYEEYVYANNALTKIGDTSVDLSQYATKTSVTEAIKELAEAIDGDFQDYMTSEQVTKAISDAIANNVGNGTITLKDQDNNTLGSFSTNQSTNQTITITQTSGGTDYSWVTKTISSSRVTLGIRTIINEPTGNFQLNIPNEILDGEEYVLRCVNGAGYTITLGDGFTNPWNVDLELTSNATDQFVFVAINGTLELQAEVALA